MDGGRRRKCVTPYTGEATPGSLRRVAPHGGPMSTELPADSLEPQPLTLTPAEGALPDKPTMGGGGDDAREARHPLPRGPFRQIADPGEPTMVPNEPNMLEETGDGPAHSQP